MKEEIILEFQDVTKKYGEKRALNHFTAKLTPGIYGLLGPNGAGKSTLMNLLTDNIKRTEGTICYNGEEILKLGSEFRAKIGYMPQQQGMYDHFSGERFLYYVASLKGVKRKQAGEQIDKYLNLVGLKKDSHRKLGGYSGGMRQRLMFVAAMLGEPEILILDDSASALDFATDAKLRRAIAAQTRGMTVFIVSQRAASIKDADQILVLDDGRQVGLGTHRELLETCGVYHEICMSQFSEKELEKS